MKINSLIKTAFLLLCILLVLGIAKSLSEPVSAFNDNSKSKIISIVSKKYPNYEIEDMKLTYSDWSSTVREVDNYNKAESANVVIKNDEEQRTIHFRREMFSWVITDDEPDYGSNIPDDIYFVEYQYESIGSAVDIENHIKERNYWIIPDEEGNLYRKAGERNWYYSLKHCDNIYKTKDGKVYEFDKNINDWVESDETYSSLCYYGNYTKVDKSVVLEILEKYSTYKEN